MHSSKLSKAATTDVMSDIPLLCEGVMGIGTFMFLVLVKKVCRLSIFLHASSFLTFVSATLDLSRVVAGHTNAYPFFIAREVLLSLAYPLLNLYFWELVAERPRSEANPKIITKKRKRHSADWDRWGFPGEALKWLSLAALLTVPGLQLLWRLLPTERRHSAIYVADSVLQTTLSSIFILKFVFNAYGSLSKPFWQAIRPNVVPILVLLIDLTLSTGNLLLFAFADSVLGRFLHAVGVYILLLFNLYTSFQDFVDPTHNKRRTEPVISSPQFHEKENARTTVLEQYPFRSKSQLSSLATKPAPQQDIRREKRVGIPSVLVDDSRDKSSCLVVVPASSVPSPSSSAFKFYTALAATPVIRPDSSILTNSVFYVQDTQQVATHALDVSSMRFDGLEPTLRDQDLAQDSDRSENRRRLSSLDRILRHRDEVDKSIAQLSSLHSLYGGFNPLDLLPMDIPASTSPSDKSLFSLSIFPDPPSNLKDVVDPNRVQPLRISGNGILLPEMLRPGISLRSSRLESTSTWDVTSFIRNLITDSSGARVMVAPMYTESGVGPAFPRTYSELVTLESLVLYPTGDESLARVDEFRHVERRAKSLAYNAR